MSYLIAPALSMIVIGLGMAMTSAMEWGADRSLANAMAKLSAAFLIGGASILVVLAALSARPA